MKKNIYYKVHKSKYGLLVAACDKEISGKVLKDRKKQLDFFVNPRFYKEEEGSKENLKNALSYAADANLIGKDAVDCGVELGLVAKGNIIKIAGVPHAIYTIMQEH